MPGFHVHVSDNMKMGPYINGLYHNCNRNVKTVVGHYALNKFSSDFVSGISRPQNRDQTGFFRNILDFFKKMVSAPIILGSAIETAKKYFVKKMVGHLKKQKLEPKLYTKVADSLAGQLAKSSQAASQTSSRPLATAIRSWEGHHNISQAILCMYYP